jgi:hypothetical protein
MNRYWDKVLDQWVYEYREDEDLGEELGEEEAAEGGSEYESFDVIAEPECENLMLMICSVEG